MRREKSILKENATAAVHAAENGQVPAEHHVSHYRAFMDGRALNDPRSAVGGLWEELGQYQLDLMISQGLLPHHTLLDIGCGCFRGGRKFIPYLKAGRYTGIDISQQILDAGVRMLAEEGVDPSRYDHFRLEDMSFRPLQGRTFDFILAQSVFTHVPVSVIDECFEHLRSIMHEASRFVFTYFRGDEIRYDTEMENYYYPKTFWAERAQRFGLDLAPVEALPHPRGQIPMVVSLRS